jgi:simple sugar transport system ATP-binding protein
MNILYGLYHPTEGEIKIKGRAVRFHNPRDAINNGIGMVHQHFQLVPVMTVAENVVLGSEITTSFGKLDMKQAAHQVTQLSQKYGLAVDPSAVIENLPVGIQQRVEIIKALYRKTNILILDEPTAVLTPQEARELFRIMRDLTAQGISIIFITHKLKEVLEIADRIAVMRRGKMVGTVLPNDATEASLAKLMVGRSVLLKVEKSDAHPSDVVLKVENLTVQDDRKVTVVEQVSLEVRAGEVLGIAGVQGNGQTELVEALTGIRPIQSGSIHIAGKDTTHSGPRQVTEQEVAHIPEDRERHGLVMAHSIEDNIVLNTYYHAPYSRGGVIDRSIIREKASALATEYDIRPPNVLAPASTLSGGNKQKVIVAREFSHPVKLLIAAQPTRGIDVGSIEFIHNQIIRQRDQGVGVLLVSAELDEIISLSDRIAVMFAGRIIATMPSSEATREKLGLLMAGSTQ